MQESLAMDSWKQENRWKRQNRWSHLASGLTLQMMKNWKRGDEEWPSISYSIGT